VERQPIRPTYLVAHGFTGVIDGWVTTITTAMEDNAKADLLDHRLVTELLPSYLHELATVEGRRAELDAQIKAATTTADDEDDESADDTDALSPTELATLKRNLANIKKQQKSMQREFITKLGKARAELTAAEERDLVLRLAKTDLAAHLDGYVTAQRQQITVALENWWAKYAVPLNQIEADRDKATNKLSGFLRELGYE
jgi:type I restriction enzyme M protein